MVKDKLDRLKELMGRIEQEKAKKTDESRKVVMENIRSGKMKVDMMKVFSCLEEVTQAIDQSNMNHLELMMFHKTLEGALLHDQMKRWEMAHVGL